CFVQGNDIGIAFYQNRAVALGDLAFGLEQPVKFGTLIEKLALGGIEVFGIFSDIFRVAAPAAERDHIAVYVVYRENDAIIKEIAGLMLFDLYHARSFRQRYFCGFDYGIADELKICR